MLPLKSFYMLRHGETTANAARIAAGGQLDAPLNDNGIKQAKTLASLIDQLEVKPRVIYHSDMQRARDTATFVNKNLKLEMFERHDLREHDLGEWDGQPWHEVLPLLENKQTPKNGESEIQFATRIQSSITEILEITSKPEDNTPPMIVAHGGLFHALGFLYEYGISPVQNCHLHHFEPHPENALFPWRVWHFDIKGDTLLKQPAYFCPIGMEAAS